MISIRGLDHIVLRTNCLDAMLAFYQQHLGCRLEREESDIGLYQLRAGDHLIDLVPTDKPLGAQGGPAPGSAGHNVDHLCLTLTHFDGDALIRYLDRAGIAHSTIERRYGAEGFGPSIYIEDPQGNRIELKGPAEAGSCLR